VLCYIDTVNKMKCRPTRSLVDLFTTVPRSSVTQHLSLVSLLW